MPKTLRTKKRIFDLVFIMTFKQPVKSEEKEKKNSKWRQTMKERKEPGSILVASAAKPSQ